MPGIYFGNTAPIEARKLDEATTDVVRIPKKDELGVSETFFDIPSEWSLARQIDYVRSVFASHHSDEDPAWVESTNDPQFAEILAKEFDIPIGRPDDWDDLKVSPETSTEEIASDDVANAHEVLNED